MKKKMRKNEKKNLNHATKSLDSNPSTHYPNLFLKANYVCCVVVYHTSLSNIDQLLL